jgi:hypothetical protein
MAYANLNDGKIRGCKKGTLTYYHELAHLNYEDTERGQRVRTIQEFSIDALISSSALYILYPNSIFKGLVLCFILLKIFSNLAEEISCWNSAKIKLSKKERWKEKRSVGRTNLNIT